MNFAKNILLLFCSAIIFIVATKVHAQSELRIFGSMQAISLNDYERMEMQSKNGTSDSSFKRNVLSVQQLDIFVSKDICERFSLFADIAFNYNYSSEKNRGSLSLNEAWLNYAHNDAFNIKVGLLIPRFSHLNEHKNRLALLPYIYRSSFYEPKFSRIHDSEDGIPQDAFMQIYGIVPAFSNFSIDYAAFMGDSEGSSLSDDTRDLFNRNIQEDFTLKMFGARVGIVNSSETFRTGVSMTHDYDKNNHVNIKLVDVPKDLGRYRICYDFGLNAYDFDFEGEFIYVLYEDTPSEVEITKANGMMITLQPENFKLISYYINMLYNFSDKLFAYTKYNYVKNTLRSSRINEISIGGGYHLTDDVTAKIQYVNFKQTFKYDMNEEFMATYKMNMLLLGISVFF